MRTFEVALKVIPSIKDEKKRILEEKVLLDLWLAMDEIKAKVSYQQTEIPLDNQGDKWTYFDKFFNCNCSAGILPAFGLFYDLVCIILWFSLYYFMI